MTRDSPGVVSLDARIARGSTPGVTVTGDGELSVTAEVGHAVIEVSALEGAVSTRAVVSVRELLDALTTACETSESAEWLDDVDDGAGCAETWEAACERRRNGVTGGD